MEKNDDLLKLANEMRDHATTGGKFDDTKQDETKPATPVKEAVAEDEPVVIVGADPVAVNVDISTESASSSTEITLDDLRSTMPEVSEEYLKEIGMKNVVELNQYMKNLIIEHGITPEEAYKATKARTKNIGEEIQKEWLKNNPKLGIVEIDKKDSNIIQFTKEEHEKLEKVKAIRLIEVEDVELKTLDVKLATRELKANYINEARLSLTRDAVPLIGLSDYVAFNGVQIVTIYSSIMLNDDSIHESLMRKARVAYDAMEGGMHYKKYDSNRKLILTFEQFLNTFPYYDLDMSLFSCLCASSPEKTTANFGCRKCGTRFDASYNVRNLIKFDGISESTKKLIDDILANRSNAEILAKMISPLYYGKRMKSTGSSIIYDLKIPSLAKALSILQFIDRQNAREAEADLSLFSTVVFIDTIHLPKDGGYIDYSAEEADLFWDMCKKLPQEDLDAVSLLSERDGRILVPSYELDLTCSNPNCGMKLHNNFTIDQLIFQRAQDTPVKTTLSEN